MSKTVSGELITIDDSAYDGLDDIVIYGNTRQNLWANPSRTSNGVTVKANQDGSITVSGTATARTYITALSYALRPGTQYTLRVDKSTNARGFYVDVYNADNQSIQVVYVGGSQGMSLSETFTLKSNAMRVLFGFGVEPGTTVSGTYRVMLNEGSEAQPWCPPGLNGVDELSIVTAGKNLFNATAKDNEDNFHVGPDGAITLGADFSWKTFDVQKIHIPKGTKIAFSKSVTLGANCGPGVWLSDRSGHQVEFIIYGSLNENNHITSRDYEYIQCFVNDGTVTADTPFYVQLELGFTATDYEPPSITTTSIDLQGHTLNALPDGTRDELHIDGGGNVVLEKRVGAATAPTSAGSWFWETAGDGIASFTLPAKSTGTQTDMTEIMRCDKLPVRQEPGEASYAMVGTTQGHAKNPAITSAATAATVVGGATYIYPLAEPQTISLGTVELPQLPAPNLTAWAETDVPADISIRYVKDIDIVLENLGAAMGTHTEPPASSTVDSDAGEAEQPGPTSEEGVIRIV